MTSLQLVSNPDNNLKTHFAFVNHGTNKATERVTLSRFDLDCYRLVMEQGKQAIYSQKDHRLHHKKLLHPWHATQNIDDGNLHVCPDVGGKFI